MRVLVFASIVMIFVMAGASAKDIAIVNNKKLTEIDLNAFLFGMNEGQRRVFLRDSNSRNQAVNGLIDQELLAQEARKEKIHQSPEFLAARAAFEKRFLAERVVQKRTKNRLSERAARKFYNRNKSRFSTDQVRVSHILAKTEKQASRYLAQAKKTKSIDAFKGIAEKHSVDPTARNNRGDLGYISRTSSLDRAFLNAAFSAKKGQVVGPVKTAYGYHVMKIEDRIAGRILEYDDVKLRVQAELQASEVEAIVAGLRKKAKIVLK